MGQWINSGSLYFKMLKVIISYLKFSHFRINTKYTGLEFYIIGITFKFSPSCLKLKLGITMGQDECTMEWI